MKLFELELGQKSPFTMSYKNFNDKDYKVFKTYMTHHNVRQISATDTIYMNQRKIVQSRDHMPWLYGSIGIETSLICLTMEGWPQSILEYSNRKSHFSSLLCFIAFSSGGRKALESASQGQCQ